jgi:Rrf2 family protein
MLSSRAKYALRAVVLLAERQNEERWTLAGEMAEQAVIPRKFLEAILVELRDNGIVESRRGRYGGYRLNRAPADIRASDVIRVVDGPLALTPCASRTQYAACTDCVGVDVCPLRPMLQKARDAIAKVLEGQSLADLARKRRNNGRVATDLDTETIPA